MSDIYLSLTETPSVVTLSQPVVASVMVNTVTVANVVSVNVVTMPAITVQAAVSGGLSNAELRASAVSVAVTTMPALSISSVSISNFPATQTIAGTVTANGGNFSATDGAVTSPSQVVAIGYRDSAGNGLFKMANSDDQLFPVRIADSIPISGTVTVGASSVTFNSNVAKRDDGSWTNLGVETGSGYVKARVYPSDVAPFTATVTVGNSVTISSIPAISGTVTANIGNSSAASAGFVKICGEVAGGAPSDPKEIITDSQGMLYARIAPSNSLTSDPVKYDPVLGDAYINVRQYTGTSVTIGSLPTLAPQLPRVTFIDGSGSVVTANSAVTLFASSTTRSYLLVQVTTGSAFVNVGATATTLNGINLTAGQGYAWETTIPQGLVSLISTTTSSRWVAKEA